MDAFEATYLTVFGVIAFGVIVIVILDEIGRRQRQRRERH
jgi:hypothetical protein